MPPDKDDASHIVHSAVSEISFSPAILIRPYSSGVAPAKLADNVANKRLRVAE